MTPAHQQTLEFIASAIGFLFLTAFCVAAIVNSLWEAGARVARSYHEEDTEE